MEKDSFYNLNIAEVVVRYLVMMAVIIAAVFAKIPVLAFIALPIFLTALIGHCPIKKMFQNASAAAPAARQKTNASAHATSF